MGLSSTFEPSSETASEIVVSHSSLDLSAAATHPNLPLSPVFDLWIQIHPLKLSIQTASI